MCLREFLIVQGDWKIWPYSLPKKFYEFWDCRVRTEVYTHFTCMLTRHFLSHLNWKLRTQLFKTCMNKGRLLLNTL